MQKKNYPFVTNLKYIWIVFIFLTIKSFSQSIDKLNGILDSQIPQKNKIIIADSLVKSLEVVSGDSLQFVYQDYAYWLSTVNKLKEAILFSEKAFDLAKKNALKDIENAQYSGISLAFNYYDNQQFLESIAVSQYVVGLNNTNSQAIFGYLELGKAYSEIDDYYKAYDSYKRAIDLLKKNGGYRQFLRGAYYKIAGICFTIKTEESLKEGIFYGKLADSLASILKTSVKDRFGIKLNQGMLYDNKKKSRDSRKALKYFEEALELANTNLDTTKIIRSYQALGDFYDRVDQKKSIEFYEKAIELTKRGDTIKLAQLYNGLGFVHNVQKEFEKSIKYRHMALEFCTGNDFFDIHTVNDAFLLKIKNKSTLRFILQQLAETYLDYFDSYQNEEFLKKSLAYFKMADFLIDQLRMNSRVFKSRLFWRELSTNIYGKAIRAAYLQNSVADVFYFMEKNKALLLIEDITREQFKRAIKLPIEVMQKETRLKEELAQIKTNLGRIDLSTKTIDSLKKRLLEVNLLFKDFLDEWDIETHFSFESESPSLEETQQEMNENEVLVEYHISIDQEHDIYSNKENGYVLFITKTDSYLYEIEELSKLKIKVEELINAIKRPFKSKEDIPRYSKLSNHIYSKLFPSEKVRKLIKNKKVTIIPDNYLSLIPYEALSTSNQIISYLIHDAEIHYIYSNSFLKTRTPRQSKGDSFLGIAPIQYENQDLAVLNYSKIEMDLITSHFSGKVFLNESATKDLFLRELANHDVIHLATHADAVNLENPWIALRDQKITLNELYLTKNNASLVVLSACNTGLGKQEIGEGVMSLARGFLYSGAESVISSLWKINDLSTSVIMDSFYNNLRNGETKSSALHNAKLSYLNTHKLPDSSPYHWAPFVLLGENNSIQDTSYSLNFYIILIGSLIILLLLLLFFKKTR